MSNNDRETLNELLVDEEIWYIYFFIVIASIYSNRLRRDFIRTNNEQENRAFHTINIIVLSIAFFIYLHFLKVNTDHLKKTRSFEDLISLAGVALLVASGALLLIAEVRRSTSDSVILGL